MANINVESKSREFISILDTHFQEDNNLSKLKLIKMLVFALCEAQTVGNVIICFKSMGSRVLAISHLFFPAIWQFFLIFQSGTVSLSNCGTNRILLSRVNIHPV
jgi:hypothetical protein